jgi:hypothetical protein
MFATIHALKLFKPFCGGWKTETEFLADIRCGHSQPEIGFVKRSKNGCSQAICFKFIPICLPRK